MYAAFDWYPLVDPADRYPLRFSRQRLYCFAQTGVCGVHVVVDDRQIKVLFIQPLDLLRLLQGVPEIPLLKRKPITRREILIFNEQNALSHEWDPTVGSVTVSSQAH